MPSLPRLYAILDIDTLAARGLDARFVLDAWLDAGIRWIQLRAKSTPSGALLTLADQLARTAQSAGATFVLNDRADLALMAAADGVHVGQDDLTPSQVRSIEDRESFSSRGSGRASENDSQSRLLVGLSTHTLDQLRAGLTEPADYLAIGPIFPTSSKAQADPVVGLAMVRDAAEIAGGRPLVAIGGITLETAPAVLAAGASSVAVIADMLTGDIRGRALAFVDAICQ